MFQLYKNIQTDFLGQIKVLLKRLRYQNEHNPTNINQTASV